MLLSSGDHGLECDCTPVGIVSGSHLNDLLGRIFSILEVIRGVSRNIKYLLLDKSILCVSYGSILMIFVMLYGDVDIL